MFQKISKFKNPFRNPSPPKSPDVDIPDPKKVKDTDPVKSGAQGFAAASGAAVVTDLASKLLSSKNPADVFIGKVMTNAKRQGENAEQLEVELGEREVLISQLLVSMPESLLAKYFDEFLFKKDIPWTATREFMQKAVNAEKQGASARDVLDFALVFYDKRRNYGNTIYVIDTALDLQPSMRNVNIFQALKDSLEGTRKSGMNFMLLGPENIDNAIVLNKLMGMVLARGAEDLEVLRREYQKSKDQLQRKREVADRFRGIYDTMMSMEFQSALKRNVQFVTEQFALAANDPQVQSFARILYDIKLGQEFRSEIFAGLEGRQTAQKSPGLAEQSRAPMTRSTSSDYRFVKAQTNASVITPQYKENLRKYLSELLRATNILLEKCKSKKPDDVAIATDVSPLIKTASENLNQAILSIDTTPFNFARIYKLYCDVLRKFDAVEVLRKQYELNQRNANNLFVKNIKTAEDPNKRPEGSALNVNSPTSGAGGGNGEFLSQEAARVSETVFKGVAGTAGVVAFATGDLKTALAAGTALFLQQKNETALNIAKTAGIEPPKDFTPQYVLDDAAEALKIMGANDSEQKEYLANDQFIKSVNATIELKERSLALVIDAQTKTSDGNIEGPLESPEAAEKSYRDFMAYLRQANQYCSRQNDLVRFIIARNKDATNVQKLGSLQQYQAMVSQQVETIRAKLSEYSSFTEIVSNIQNQKFLLMKVKELIPQLDKYLSTGLSVADVIGSEGGVLDKVKQYIDFEVDSYNKLFKKYNEIIAQFPSVKPKVVTKPEQLQPQTGQNPVTIGTQRTSELNSESSRSITASENSSISNLMFSNLMFEKNIRLSAVDPQQQAKYNYYIETMKKPGMNLQNLVRALDSDSSFTDMSLKLLARRAIIQKSLNLFGAELTSRPAYEGSNTNAQGLNVAPSQQQTQQSGGISSTTSGTGTSVTPQIGTAGTGATTPLPTDAETNLYNEFKKLQKEFETRFGNMGIVPSADTLNYNPKRDVMSLRTQLQKVFENIQVMQKIYYQLLQNPSDFGGIIPALKRNASSKFTRISKFEKVEDKNQIKQSDEELERYYNEEMDYAPYGTALEHPQENRNKTIDEIKTHSSTKFKKI